jgi:hypothetical protein
MRVARVENYMRARHIGREVRVHDSGEAPTEARNCDFARALTHTATPFCNCGDKNFISGGESISAGGKTLHLA